MFETMNIGIDKLPSGWTVDELYAALAKARTPHLLTEREREGLKEITPPQKNPCNGCSLCCTAPSISANDAKGTVLSEQKPACKKCRFSTDKGCSVYAERPNICKDYLCAYALGDIPNYPMTCGVAWVYQTTADGQPLLVGHCMNAEEAVNREDNRHVIEQALASGIFYAVTVRDDQELVCFTRDGWIDFAEIKQSDPLKQEVDTKTIRHKVARIKVPEYIMAGVSPTYVKRKSRRAIG
jgi:uncharacterized cysteine cluster protein YcgN (CxxCxxCC family)